MDLKDFSRVDSLPDSFNLASGNLRMCIEAHLMILYHTNLYYACTILVYGKIQNFLVDKKLTKHSCDTPVKLSKLFKYFYYVIKPI